MTADTDGTRKCWLRVLIVDNDPEVRERHTELVQLWGYLPVVARGNGTELRNDAIDKAQRYRCQIALVDMRLYDDHDLRDWSGLELVPDLQPTDAIIVSGFGDRLTAVAALKQYGALDFVGKEDGPERLQQTIEEIARTHGGCCHYRPQIIWSNGLTSASICDSLLPGQHDVPPSEADELIGRMFPKATKVVLTLISAESASSERMSAMRRQSRVFRARVDDLPAFRVVKLARAEKMRRELQNYERYVQYHLRGMFAPTKQGEALLWDIGAVSYSYLGNPGLGTSHGPQTFTNHYRTIDSPEQILTPLRDFFDPLNWGDWYRKDVTVLNGSLFEAYDLSWNGVLSKQFGAWRAHDSQHVVPGLTVALPNPTRWLAHHTQDTHQIIQARQAVTHGDLHGDNLFVSKDHAWPIDFERTGPGPIMRDFVELIQDIVTRIAPLSSTHDPSFTEQSARIVYELAVALCAPQNPTDFMPLPETIRDHQEAYKAFEVIQMLQQLAYEHTRYEDRREYLWGLLLNNLFVVTLLPGEDPRRTRSLLLASVLCARLERWNRPIWPPREWPSVTWVEPRALEVSGASTGAMTRPKSSAADSGASQPRFAHGHALLIGVGADLPVTVADAIAIRDILVDPQRCAYPHEQVALLTAAQATRQPILDGLDRLAAAARADPEATVVVYFSGHGVRTPEASYLVPYGFNPAHLAATAVAGATFTEKLRAIPARKLLVLLDCCHAGGVAEAKSSNLAKAAIPPELEAALLPGSGRVVIASSRQREYSYTGTPYSVFTQALREALAGAETADQDGFAYVTDIAMHVGRVVPARTNDRQHPVLKLAEADNFAVAYYAGGAKTPLPLAPPQPEMLPGGLRNSVQPAQARPAVAEVRKRLKQLTDAEFEEFCLDYFPAVALNFTPGQILGAKITRLLDACVRKPGELERLAELLADEA